MHLIIGALIKGKNEQPAQAGAKLDEMMKKHGAIYKGSSAKKNIYLTFDNGYENGYTANILNILRRQHVPATFFVTGHYLKTEPDLVVRMVKEGQYCRQLFLESSRYDVKNGRSHSK